MTVNPLPSLEILKERFVLNPTHLTGLQYKIACNNNNQLKPGDMAGCIKKDGYGQIQINNKRYLTHRIVYYLSTGVDPMEYEVDHIDQNPSNNCITNLRLATRSNNMNNTSKRSDNKSGIKGVTWNKQINKWRAQIRINGKYKYLGYFTNIDDAAAAYATAAKKYHGEFACLN